jgi:zinc protease
MMRVHIPLIIAAVLFLYMGLNLLPRGSAQIRIPPLQFRERTLTNGLKLISLEDHTSPTVAIQVWYRVGSKDDPEKRSGFAHLFEHIMFKGTKNMKDEMMDRLTEDVGGFNNASTADDYTNYFEVIPSNYLETLLWAEAERLASLNVNEANFRSERDVVKEEFRQRILAPPYVRLFYLIEQKSFTHHPYRRPGIGSIEDLDAASLQDVREFHATYYRPDNVVLVVAGDFEPAQLDAWVDKYFAIIPKPREPVPRVRVNEPPRKAERRHSEHAPNVPLPAVAMTYLVPPVRSEDAPVLNLAQAILSAGESSRLYQSLVYRRQVAQEAFASADLREDAGLFIVGAILASGKKPAEAERALLAEISALQQKPVPAPELDKARNQLITSELRQRETSNGKAFALARASVLLGDASKVNSEIERLQTITAEDLQRVMKRYFAPANRVVITYLPESRRSKDTPARRGGGR